MTEQTADAEATDPTQTDAPAQATTEEKPKRVKKEPAQPHACMCRVFMVGNPAEGAEFTTECDSTTKSVFAQGHDAALVSFLVNAQLDGYKLYRVDGDTRVQFQDAGHAAASLSEALGAKADKAIANHAAREKEKAERRAATAQRRAENKAARDAEKAKAKAAAPKPVAAKVVEGSQSGDAPSTASRPEVGEGEEAVTIKIGRNEIPATMNADKTEVRWVNAKGEPQSRPADSVRILEVA